MPKKAFLSHMIEQLETVGCNSVTGYTFCLFNQLCVFMKKSDKKIDNALREALTNVCETALGSVEGFVWLTHVVNYNAFPNSLKIVCVFETDLSLSKAIEAKQDEYFYTLIHHELSAAKITLNKLHQQVSLDSEEACERSHAGKWNERLAKLQSCVTLH